MTEHARNNDGLQVQADAKSEKGPGETSSTATNDTHKNRFMVDFNNAKIVTTQMELKDPEKEEIPDGTKRAQTQEQVVQKDHTEPITLKESISHSNSSPAMEDSHKDDESHDGPPRQHLNLSVTNVAVKKADVRIQNDKKMGENGSPLDDEDVEKLSEKSSSDNEAEGNLDRIAVLHEIK